MNKSLFSLAALVLAGLFSFSFAGDKAGKDAKDRHEPGGSAAVLGQPAPLFSLQDQNGHTVNLSDFKDKVVVLEWFNEDCPYVVRHYSSGSMQKQAKEMGEKGVVWLAINSTKNKSNQTNKRIADEWKIDFPILNDSTGEVGHLYGAKTTPHMFVINKGVLAYNGAIDNDPQGKGATKNYVTQAVDEILAGHSVSEPMTKPYGCSVKYAR